MPGDANDFVRYTFTTEFVEPDLTRYPLDEMAHSEGVEEQDIRSQLLDKHTATIKLAAQRIKELMITDAKLQTILTSYGIKLQTRLSAEE